MKSTEPMVILESFLRFVKRKATIIMVAFMLGISNIILNETRSVNDRSDKVEQNEVRSDDEPNETIDYRVDF